MQMANGNAANPLGPIRDNLVTLHKHQQRGFSFVYAFVDRQTLKPFYVGCANDPIRRFLSHVLEPDKLLVSAEVAEDFERTGKYPYIEILERVPYELRAARERHWIASLLENGATLLNAKVAGHTHRKPHCTKNEILLRARIYQYMVEHDLSYAKMSQRMGLGRGGETLHRFLVRCRSVHDRTLRKIERFLNGVARG